ncbi:MAG TPA: cyclic nucleotide-binding domain-containing protein [Streptosporangiaceae bacterium]|nr:cyclic nucleotide-binding domain-containing protein [Streptosporangiaceae bacterium]
MSTANSPPLTQHPFLRGMAEEHIARLNQVTRYIAVPAKYRLFDEGGTADRCWLIEAGQVALDLHVPGDGPVIIETLGRGDVVGWSWLFPPFEWLLGGVTMQPTQAFELDGRAVRAMCEADSVLGHELTRRMVTVVVRRLQATRIRLLDVYGRPGAPG